MEVGQGPNWGCSAKGKKKYRVLTVLSFRFILTDSYIVSWLVRRIWHHIRLKEVSQNSLSSNKTQLHLFTSNCNTMLNIRTLVVSEVETRRGFQFLCK
jgi:hypothetical protein